MPKGQFRDVWVGQEKHSLGTRCSANSHPIVGLDQHWQSKKSRNHEHRIPSLCAWLLRFLTYAYLNISQLGRALYVDYVQHDQSTLAPIISLSWRHGKYFPPSIHDFNIFGRVGRLGRIAINPGKMTCWYVQRRPATSRVLTCIRPDNQPEEWLRLKRRDRGTRNHVQSFRKKWRLRSRDECQPISNFDPHSWLT